LAALGNPEAAFPVIHVAGTNGKGSTAAMVAEALHAAGYRVGRFTSPDLHGPHERFWLSGAVLTPGAYEARLAAVARVAETVASAFPELPPWRPFELWCALAWVYFREARVDLAVVECGMGGTHDATNVLPTKVLTLITAIGLDHALCWGGDLASVAREKAGIMRPDVPVMTTATGDSLLELEQAALQVGAPLRRVRPFDGVPAGEGHYQVSLPGGPCRLGLAGAFQLENAALAAAGLEELAARGWRISKDAVRRGLRDVCWPGRLERVNEADGGSWILDGAHNPEAVRALVATWEPPAVVVAAIQKSKDAPGMIRDLSRGGRMLVLLTLPDAEYWDPADLARWAEGPVHVVHDVSAALQLARTLAPQGRRGVTGSIYLVAACRDILRHRDPGVDSGASRVHQV
jgi:dihydrofolate synthase/folylpolyglutamate synthase